MKKNGENRDKILIFMSRYMIYFAFIALLIIFSVTLRDVGNGFLAIGNVWNIIRQTALISILCIGMCFCLGAGMIDLSCGSAVGLVSIVTAMLVQRSGIITGVLAGLAVGLLIGMVNGFLVAYLNIPAFIATLAMQILLAGLSRTVSNLKSYPITKTLFNVVFGGGTIRTVPVLVIWMLACVAIGHVLLTKRPLGRQALAVGGNQKAALYSGINTRFLMFRIMAFSGLISGLAGILWCGRYGGGRYQLGEGAENSVIAAAVLGGTSIRGGKASVLGACVGSVMMGMIDNALVMYGLDVYRQMIVRGLIIIIAVAFTVNGKEA